MSSFKSIINSLKNVIKRKVYEKVTIEAGKNKRRYIWTTKNFRDITQIYIPRFIFLNFVVIMCWKINEKIRFIKSSKLTPYKSKSMRQEKIEKENEEINYFLNLPNEFDPDKKNETLSVEYKDKVE